METLEPQATDSFFAWGFFDSVLQAKEHYSDYVFEDVAAATCCAATRPCASAWRS